MVRCDEFLGRDEFKTYSEFIFMLCVAKEYYRRGDLMDFSMMNIENVLGSNQRLMLKWCVYNGYVYIGDVDVEKPSEDEPYTFNLQAITDNIGRLFYEDDEKYEWNNEWAKNQDYGKYWSDLYSYSNLGTILLHTVAHLIVSIREGEMPRKKIRIFADNGVACSTYIYINLLNCTRTIQWFADLVEVDIDLDGKSVDVDLSLFINSGIQADRRHHWSIKDKFKQMESEGIVKGSICILYERKGVAKTNVVGKITNASVVRIDDIKGNCIYTTVIPVYRTKEEVESDFNEIPSESQSLFEDMLEFKINEYQRVVDIYGLGISNYLYDEDTFIATIDEYGTTNKLVTVDGKRGILELSQAEAIYWLLKQYGISFDEKLYKLMYRKGKEFVYDLYDCSYDDRSVRVVRGTLIG